MLFTLQELLSSRLWSRFELHWTAYKISFWCQRWYSFGLPRTMYVCP